MRTFFAIVFVGLFFVLALIFGARNEQIVTISYFVAQGEFRLPIVLAVVFLTGFIISWLFASFYIVKVKMQLRKKQKLIDKLQKAVESTQASNVSDTTDATPQPAALAEKHA